MVSSLRDIRDGDRRPLEPEVRADGESILITGASSGLGLALSADLASRGAQVLMACRSRLDEAPAEVRAAAPDAQLDVLPVDLASPAQIEALADSLVERGIVLDRLVLNAAVLPIGFRTTPSGLDLMVHVNFVANVQLVRALRRRSRLSEGARVVVVGSEAHREAPPIDLETWMQPAAYGASRVLSVYGSSKRLLHTWAETLAARSPELHVVHLCPGAMATNIVREIPGSLRWLVGPFMQVMFPSAKGSAAWVARCVLGSEFEGRTGVYVHVGREKPPGEGVRDAVIGDHLWDSAHAVVEGLVE